MQGMKRVHEASFGRKEEAGDATVAKQMLQFYVDQLSVEQVAGDLNVTSTGPMHVKKAVRKVTVAPAPGTIGNDQELVRYVEHLIKRYNDFASKDPFSNRKFSHAVIRRNISKDFGGTVRDISADKAGSLMSYLQDKIRKTSIGKKNEREEKKLYSTYDEFREKHRH